MSKIVVKNRRDLTQRKCSKPELRINNNFDDIIELQKIQMKKSKSNKKFEIPDIIIQSQVKSNYEKLKMIENPIKISENEYS